MLLPSPTALILLLALPLSTALSLPKLDPPSSSPTSPLTKRIPPGLTLSGLSFCHIGPTNPHKISVATKRAIYLARAALNAASNFTSAPYTYFFHPQLETVNLVSSIFTQALDLLTVTGPDGTGPGIRIYCGDVEERCRIGTGPKAGFGPKQGFRTVNYGYVRADYVEKDELAIILCRDEFAYTLYNPAPCDKTHMGGGLYTSEWVLLNLVLQAIALQNKKSRKSPQTHVTNLKADALTALDCVQLLEGRGIGDQVNCLADLASWAWDMGLGQPPEWGGGVCLGNAGALKLYAAQTYSKGVQEEGLAG